MAGSGQIRGLCETWVENGLCSPTSPKRAPLRNVSWMRLPVLRFCTPCSCRAWLARHGKRTRIVSPPSDLLLALNLDVGRQHRTWYVRMSSRTAYASREKRLLVPPWYRVAAAVTREPEARMQGPHLYFTNLPHSLSDHMLVSSQKAPMWLP